MKGKQDDLKSVPFMRGSSFSFWFALNLNKCCKLRVLGSFAKGSPWETVSIKTQRALFLCLCFTILSRDLFSTVADLDMKQTAALAVSDATETLKPRRHLQPKRHPGSPTLQESVTRNRKDCGNGNNVTVLEWTAYKISLKIKRASFPNSKITLLKLFQYNLFTKWSFTIKLVSSDCFIPIIIDYNNPILQITPLKQMVWTVMLN